MKRLVAIAFAAGIGCGSTQTGSGSKPAAESAAQDSDASPAATADAGAVQESGTTACDALVGRVMKCQAMADDVKQAFARSAAIWREDAAGSRENRAAAEADCRETARSMVESLRRLGC